MAFGAMGVATLFHLFEEYVYPGGFLRWMRKFSPAGAPGPVAAVAINAAFFALVLSPLSYPAGTSPIFSLSIPILLMANGLLHLLGTCLTRTYSPGVITSILCYFPAAAYALKTLPAKWHMTAAQLALAALLGIAWHLVPLLSIIIPRALRSLRRLSGEKP